MLSSFLVHRQCYTAARFYRPTCDWTTIRWDVEGVESVYFDGQGVVGHGSQNVCVRRTTNYSLTLNCGGQTKTLGLTLTVR